MRGNNVLIMAGGTGGHVFPGLALADELKKRGYVVSWLGTNKGIESRLVPKHGIQLYTLKISGVRGRGLKTLLLAPIAIFKAIFAAKKIIGDIKPDLVVGFGGYVSGPGGLASRMSGLPLLIHEQNAIAGTTNKYLAKIASRVATAFPSVFKNGEFVGNPVRKEICEIVREPNSASGQINILVMGGSRGARAINQVLPSSLALIKNLQLNVLHQAGSDDKTVTAEEYKKLGVNAEVVDFIDDMPSALRWAELVVCRSGASTVTELAQVGLPAVFIPFPFAIDDHQTANAKYLSDGNAAVVIQQNVLTPELLAATISEISDDKNTLLNMGANAKKLACENAAGKLTDMCEELIHG